MPWQIRSNSSPEFYGPLESNQVAEQLACGNFTAEDWGRMRDDEPWRQLGEFAEFELYIAQKRRYSLSGDDDDSGMDMTPMIDVTFLLLIFFMITATFHLQKGLDFPPPETQEERGAKQPAPGLATFADRIVVTIDQNDRFALKDSPAAAGANVDDIGADELVDVLSRVSQEQKRHRVFILAHDLASHEAVVKAIDSAARAGIRHVSLGDVQAAKTPAPNTPRP